jgi:hypothetical protein
LYQIEPAFDVSIAEIDFNGSQDPRKPSFDGCGELFAVIAGPTDEDFHLFLPNRLIVPRYCIGGYFDRGFPAALSLSSNAAFAFLAFVGPT